MTMNADGSGFQLKEDLLDLANSLVLSKIELLEKEIDRLNKIIEANEGMLVNGESDQGKQLTGAEVSRNKIKVTHLERGGKSISYNGVEVNDVAAIDLSIVGFYEIPVVTIKINLIDTDFEIIDVMKIG